MSTKYEWNEFWSYGMSPEAKGLTCHPSGFWHLLAYPDGSWVVMELVRAMTGAEVKEASKGLKPGEMLIPFSHETVLAKGCATAGVLGSLPLGLAQEYCVAAYEAIMAVRNKH